MRGERHALADADDVRHAQGRDTAAARSINTRNILFIVSGAFSGLDKIIETPPHARAASASAPPARERSAGETLLREARTQDFIDFGFEAEFIGRLPVRVVCDPLSADDLFQIMKCSEGSLIRQFEREFAAYGIRATFEDGALRLMAGQAAEEKTGARGLDDRVGEARCASSSSSCPASAFGGSVHRRSAGARSSPPRSPNAANGRRPCRSAWPRARGAGFRPAVHPRLRHRDPL